MSSSHDDETFVKENLWFWGGAVVESVPQKKAMVDLYRSTRRLAESPHHRSCNFQAKTFPADTDLSGEELTATVMLLVTR